MVAAEALPGRRGGGRHQPALPPGPGRCGCSHRIRLTPPRQLARYLPAAAPAGRPRAADPRTRSNRGPPAGDRPLPPRPPRRPDRRTEGTDLGLDGWSRGSAPATESVRPVGSELEFVIQSTGVFFSLGPVTEAEALVEAAGGGVVFTSDDLDPGASAPAGQPPASPPSAPGRGQLRAARVSRRALRGWRSASPTRRSDGNRPAPSPIRPPTSITRNCFAASETSRSIREARGTTPRGRLAEFEVESWSMAAIRLRRPRWRL